MTQYVVRIDIPGVTAEDPAEAARIAWEWIRDDDPHARWMLEIVEDHDQELSAPVAHETDDVWHVNALPDGSITPLDGPKMVT